MDNIKIDYSGIEGDIATLTNNVTTINSSLDNINSVEKIIPESWQSNAAKQYRETVTSDIITPISNLKESLNNIQDLLKTVLNNYTSTENSIKEDASNSNTLISGGSGRPATVPISNRANTQSTPSKSSTPSTPANEPTQPDNTTTTPNTLKNM